MQDEVHDDVDSESRTSDDEHNLGILNKLLVDDSHSGLVEQKHGNTPNNEEIGQSSDHFHSMEAKGILGVRGFVRVVQEDKAHDEAHQVGYEVGCVTNDRN